MNTSKYRFEFKLEESGEWYKTPGTCFDEKTAIKRFDELILRSKMKWRLIEEKVVSNVIRNEKGKA